VADIEQAFAQVWAVTGTPLPADELPRAETIASTGDCALRVVSTAPHTAGLFRLDQLVAAVARQTLWLTDAYFVAMAPYVQALRAAAADGVDVRLLVPGASDLPLLKRFTRAGYRALLEGGIRVFEWNGPMLHAKTAVADGRWSRVGSTNLNLASWIGNYELDVFIEDDGFAGQMADMYEEDLEHATEIVLSAKRRVRPIGRPARSAARRGDRRGIPSRAAAGALRLANTVGAAVGNRRLLDPAEARLMAGAGVLLLILTMICALWPLLVAVPLATVGAWLTIALLLQAWRLYRKGKASREAPAETPEPSAAPHPRGEIREPSTRAQRL
jgi:cardiolipin synthase